MCTLLRVQKAGGLLGDHSQSLLLNAWHAVGATRVVRFGQVPVTEDVTLYPMRRFERDEWDNLVAYYALRVRARQSGRHGSL